MSVKPNLLFVEDDINLQYVTRDNLEENGYSVECFSDGKSALDSFQSGNYDLCILDVMLPEMDGFTLADKIRQIDHNVPIIFLTAKSMKEDRIQGLKLGGDDYITKPFSMEELVLRIEVFLKRSKVYEKEAISEVFQIGNYEYDYPNLTLRIEGNEKQLTQREADLLRYFCQNIDHILKREDILNAIWGDDDYFLGRSLDVFIFRLRKYLKNDPAIQIENIHGVGFKMTVRSTVE